MTPVQDLANRLDKIHPDWYEHIDTTRLDMTSSNRCVLGQLAQHYHGVPFFGAEICIHGRDLNLDVFAIASASRGGAHQLKQEWVAEIDARLNPPYDPVAEAESIVKKARIPAPLLMLLLPLLLFLGACTQIDEGEATAFVRYGRLVDIQSDPGLNWFNIITTDVVNFPTRAQELTFNMGEDTLPAISALSAEGAQVSVDLSVWFSADPENLTLLYQQVGKSWDEVEFKAVSQIRSKVRDCLPQYEFEEARTSARGLAQSCILNSLRESIPGVVFSEVLLRDMRASSELQAAIDEKLQAQNDVKEAEFKQQEQEVVNATNIARARAEAEAEIVRAEAAAEAVKIAAAAEAEANRLISSSLTPDLLELLIATELANGNATLFLGDGGNARIDVPVGP